MVKTLQKIDSIQGLRAIAVVLVVYTHAIDSSMTIFSTSTQLDFFYLENWGSIGLDLFFVISGFIVTRIIYSYRQEDGWKVFAYKRILRIIPLYWGLSIVATILTIRTYPIRAATFVKTVLFFPIFESAFEFPVIGVGWSLSYEVYFYSIVVILLVFQAREIKLIALLLLLLLALLGTLYDSPVVILQFLTSPLLIEFALGIGCGILYDLIKTNSNSARFGMVTFSLGILTMLSSIFWNYGEISEAGSVTSSNYLAFLRSIFWGIPCSLFLLGCTLLERAYSLAIPSLLIRIGDASYSNYLLHGLLISFGRRTILELNLSADLYILFLVIMCTAASLLMYRFVEKPLTDSLTNYFFPRKLKTT
ncbi:acyltransferase family protein [Fibrella aquatica]|uniref:acyltransferase family protein n=1 Tax=Fibrella aquatica TaxID=3242487 RepID=UPI003521EAEB